MFASPKNILQQYTYCVQENAVILTTAHNTAVMPIVITKKLESKWEKHKSRYKVVQI
jgi:hypothetical protein